MKGRVTVNINGKDIKLLFVMGVHEDMSEWKKKHGVESDDDPRLQRVMFALMELYATESEWDCDDIIEKAEARSRKYKLMGFDQVKKVTDMINDATKGIAGNVPGKGKK